MVVKKKGKLQITSKESAPPRRVNRNARVIDPAKDDDLQARMDLDAERWESDVAYIESTLGMLNFDNMEKEDLLREIQNVDREYLRINLMLSQFHKRGKQRGRVFRGDGDALTLQLRTLKQRSDMLFKCLDKVLPDKREITGSLRLDTTETDQIPDKILKKIIAGTLTEAEHEHYQHLFEKAEERTKH